MSKPASYDISVARAKASRTLSMSARFMARGVWRPSMNGIADGARISQLAFSPRFLWPSQERVSEPLRPAWASCTATLEALCSWMKSVTRFHAPTCSGEYMPAQCMLMRPSGSTSVISLITRPAPPTARLPRCTSCQSVTVPSLDEYMHIGDTTTRFGMVTPRSVIGANIGGGGRLLASSACGATIASTRRTSSGAAFSTRA
jgi:hypothetical protein